jgi:hypothetical protein
MATKEELTKALELIFKEKAKLFNGLEGKKSAIINKVLENITKDVLQNLDPAELKNLHKNPTMKKILTYALVVAHQLILNPGMKLNIGLLFKKNPTPADKKDLKKILDVANKFITDPKDRLTEDELSNYRLKNPGLDHKPLPSEIKDQIKENNSNDTSVADTSNTSGLMIVITEAGLNPLLKPDLNAEAKLDNRSRSMLTSSPPTTTTTPTVADEPEETTEHKFKSPFDSMHKGPTPSKSE